MARKTIAKDPVAKLVLRTYEDGRVPDLQLVPHHDTTDFIDVTNPAKTVRKLAKALGVELVTDRDVLAARLESAHQAIRNMGVDLSAVKDVAAKTERLLIAAETRDPGHLAEMKRANLDPQSRRLRYVIERREQELAVIAAMDEDLMGQLRSRLASAQEEDQAMQRQVSELTAKLARREREWEDTRQQGLEQVTRLIERNAELRLANQSLTAERDNYKADVLHQEAKLDQAREAMDQAQQSLAASEAVSQHRLELLEDAWGIIANARQPTSMDRMAEGGDEWATAAVRFRESYHAQLPLAAPAPMTPGEQHLADLAEVIDAEDGPDFQPMAQPAAVATEDELAGGSLGVEAHIAPPGPDDEKAETFRQGWEAGSADKTIGWYPRPITQRTPEQDAEVLRQFIEMGGSPEAGKGSFQLHQEYVDRLNEGIRLGLTRQLVDTPEVRSALTDLMRAWDASEVAHDVEAIIEAILQADTQGE